jgi:formimidoylglutamate deiminase
MRGTAQRRGAGASSDFWSWRDEMYRLAGALTPESLFDISAVAFRELRRAGVLTVGEFHYVHHQAGGTPYDDRTILSDSVIRAARASGLRIALLRVAYHRAGPGRDAEDAQTRFCDPAVDDVLRDVDTLRVRYASDPGVRIGIAPHSVRAVPPSWLMPIADYAARHALPMHMHIAEQTREIDECVAETGRRPIELVSDAGCLSPRFVAVHATQLASHEAKLLGDAQSFACICATTERDLGDGLPNITDLRAYGVRLCTGVDSHVVTDPLEDLRALETHERLRLRARITHTPAKGTLAEALWHEGSTVGANACGFADAGGKVAIDCAHPSLELVAEENLLDAVVFGASPAVVARSFSD